MRARKLRFAFAILVIFSACSLDQNGRDSGQRPTSEGSITVAPMTFKQVLSSYTSLTGVTVDNNLQTAFNEAKNQLPSTGVTSEVTSATVLALANLVTRICFTFVTAERNNANPAARKIYREFDFNQLGSLTNA